MGKIKHPENIRVFQFNRSGMTFVFVFATAIMGTYLLTSSKAAPSSPVTNVNFINASSAAVSPGVTTVPSIVNQVGSQSVSQVAPGGKLTYVQGLKGTIKSVCYYVSVQPMKGGSLTATVEFTSPTETLTTNLTYTDATANTYHGVCVGAGRKTSPGYNVYNKSPATGPNILVYQQMMTL